MLFSPGDGTTVYCSALKSAQLLLTAEAPCCPLGHQERLGAVS